MSHRPERRLREAERMQGLNPMAQHARFMAAFCRDIASGAVSAGKTPQADAVAGIARQQRDTRAA